VSDENMREALQASIDALDDWLNTYASDMCDQERVEAAWKRITDNGGTLAYIAHTQQRNREALSQPAVVEGWKLVPVEPTQEMVKAAQTLPEVFSLGDEYHIMLAAAPTLPQSEGARGAESVIANMPPELHEATKDLVRRFAEAMAEKFHKAEQKYGYSDGWLDPTWMDECRQKLIEHLAKGDPRDVANYCAFLWHHGESTAASGLLSEKVEQEAVEPVATILPSDPYDERDGLWLSLEDRKRLSQLPAGTKIFTFSPTAQQALRMAADVVLKPMDDPQMTVLERDIRAEILGKILALAPTAPAQQAREMGFADEFANLVTVDRRDLHDFVRAAIKDALSTKDELMHDESWLWAESDFRACKCLNKLSIKEPK
jgi:hypothetical protein